MAVALSRSWKPALIVALGVLVVAGLTIAPSNHTFAGTITDSMCPTGDHSKIRMGSTDAECTEACVRLHGASYALYDGKTTYALSDQTTPEKFAGAKVKVFGTLDAATKTIRVDSITDKNLDSLAAAYLAMVTIFAVYLFSVARRVTHLEDEIRRLAKTD
jgi:hypothetical protein